MGKPDWKTAWVSDASRETDRAPDAPLAADGRVTDWSHGQWF